MNIDSWGLSAPSAPVSPVGRGLSAPPICGPSGWGGGGVGGRGPEPHHVSIQLDVRTNTAVAIITQRTGAGSSVS